MLYSKFQVVEEFSWNVAFMSLLMLLITIYSQFHQFPCNTYSWDTSPWAFPLFIKPHSWIISANQNSMVHLKFHHNAFLCILFIDPLWCCLYIRRLVLDYVIFHLTSLTAPLLIQHRGIPNSRKRDSQQQEVHLQSYSNLQCEPATKVIES